MDEAMTGERFHKILDDHEDYEIRVFVGRINVRVMRSQLLQEVERLFGGVNTPRTDFRGQAFCKCLDISIEFDHERKSMSIFHGLE